jgi:hypothetical protein
MKNTCIFRVGRLMEIDVAAGYHSTQDVDEMVEMILGAVRTLPPDTKFVVAADWRPCKLFTQEVADRALTLLTVVNDRIERSAVLHREDAPTSVLQLMRLVRESKFEQRHVFTDTTKMQEWLSEVLTLDERIRLKEFLAQR